LAWLLSRPTVDNVVIGARNEAQLLDNLGAADWTLTDQELVELDAASHVMPTYRKRLARAVLNALCA
jgi:aryl-alcohol dehydrogenase-like predicted oxidoreductase